MGRTDGRTDGRTGRTGVTLNALLLFFEYAGELKGKFKLMSVNHSARSGDKTGIYSIFSNMKVCCVLSLESPHQGDSNEFTLYTIFNSKD